MASLGAFVQSGQRGFAQLPAGEPGAKTVLCGIARVPAGNRKEGTAPTGGAGACVLIAVTSRGLCTVSRIGGAGEEECTLVQRARLVIDPEDMLSEAGSSECDSEGGRGGVGSSTGWDD